MEMIARIVLRRDAVRMGRVAEEFVEVDHCVEDVCGANPAVERLTIRFGAFTGVIVVGAAIGGDGAAIDADAVGVGSVAEGAALAASGGALLVPRLVQGGATCALAGP